MLLTNTQRDTIVAALEFRRAKVLDFRWYDNAGTDKEVAEIDAALAAVNALAGVEVVPLNTRADLPGGGRWYVCDDGEIAMVYPDIGVRAPLPKGWALIRTSEGVTGGR